MRLKQLLGIALLAMVAMATASASQLSGVLVKNHDGTGTVTILANGSFTHTEYHPTDNLMLVDLAGVSLAHPDSRVHAVFAPGVRSYRIVSYRSAEGNAVARVELSLVPGAQVKVSDVEGGVQLNFTGAPAIAPSPKEIESAADAPRVPARSRITHVSGITVAHRAGGFSLEVSGNGPMTAHTMRLASPDRFVVDIPDSLLDGRPRDIRVNSEGIKDVRAARFQAAPPATRIVLDLSQMRDFEIAPDGNKLLITLRDDRNTVPSAAATPVLNAAVPQAAQPATSRQPAVSGQQTEVASSAKTSAGSASDFVVVKPVFVAKKDPATSAEAKQQAGVVEPTVSRADRAAALFEQDSPAVATINRPPFATSASLNAAPAAINAALLQQQATAVPAAATEPGLNTCPPSRYTGEPIGMNFKDLDLKDFFRVIHEISGLNVVLDPAVHGTLTIVLDDVPWDQALAIVLNNNGLACQLEGNVLRIATLQTLKTEAEARRAQQEAQALAVPKKTITRYLSYGQSKDAVAIVKKFLSPRGDVVADPRSNALIIEDIPSVLPKVDELLKTLDRKTPEVEIEARVVASTRTFARDIGTQFGLGYAFGNNAIGGAVGKSPIDAANNPPRIITNVQDNKSIPLFNDLGATAPSSGLSFLNISSNFRLDFILTMAEQRGLLKILSRPHIVTQNNIQALIRQGQRVPVVTNQQLGGPPTVTYVDAFLRLSVTPQITAENTIFLNVDVENTVPDFTHVTGAQLNPTLNTQQATTQVLVTDGGTVVIGGVVQTTNNLAVAQIPVLGNIPLLGNLFKHQTVNTSTQELIFFITPKIIQT
ncbi:MAG TPA: type IV pilus secretin PilQ [Candidatus Angelobacter sp.]|nr:type IV pilus secretin PilQ [Candidatus Angelobacter sp.]